MDARTALAVTVSLRWYEEIFSLHGVARVADDGLWRALSAPPPLHSAAKTLRPGVSSSRARDAVRGLTGASVADSFGDLSLSEAGFVLLIDATWIHHPGAPASWLPPGWSRVRDVAALSAWVAGHGTPAVFPPAVLARGALALMARSDEGGALTGGLVLHDVGEAVGLSNIFAATGHRLSRPEVLAVAGAVSPGRPLTDYTSGADLAAAVECGFAAVGPQRVWLPPA